MSQKIVFSEVKAKVGIEDVAYDLGYRLDKKAGVGRYFEMVLGSASDKKDTIIVHNTDKAKQTFFRRGGQKGDVLTLILENLDFWNVPGDNKWNKVANVLAHFANMPMIDYSDKTYIKNASHNPQVFDSSRYVTKNVYTQNPHWLLNKRGFSNECIADFGENVLMIKDLNMKNFDGYNIGFPYYNPESGELAGYEIRGAAGFKSKAAGTDSANSFWAAEFPKGSADAVKNVYLFESAFDAMAFYQLNKSKLSLSPFALVSMGGSFTDEQINGVMKKYPVAKYWDCFDNDKIGNVYSQKLVKCVNKIPLDIVYQNGKNGEKILFLTNGTDKVSCNAEEFDFQKSAKELGIKYSVCHWKPPVGFKDWNDCLLGKRISYSVPVSKIERERNLAQHRKDSLRI